MDAYLGENFEEVHGIEDTYDDYVLHVYRTAKIAKGLKPGNDVINILDKKLVRNVLQRMTKDELEDFIRILGLR